ncbi:hypothetical protein HPB52_003742 [Rhipicephalus sanguineus]|uniref:Uncharacterized protein n=1 Tax=Rhipicephalus sanguineus TaxID=34632 RepID=A0A9D4PWP2_RHISA|nr:hypothetical protein HPB52_003742 [Rhipicephalus sanguineus]
MWHGGKLWQRNYGNESYGNEQEGNDLTPPTPALQEDFPALETESDTDTQDTEAHAESQDAGDLPPPSEKVSPTPCAPAETSDSSPDAYEDHSASKAEAPVSVPSRDHESSSSEAPKNFDGTRHSSNGTCRSPDHRPRQDQDRDYASDGDEHPSQQILCSDPQTEPVQPTLQDHRFGRRYE